MSALLDVDSVGRIYGGGLLGRRRVEAVRGVSLRLAQDQPQIVGVVGESGSGKTTLARMILGMVKPSSGSIRVGGRELSSYLPRRERLAFRRTVQPVFQNPFETFNPMKRIERYLFATARFIAGIDGDEARVKAVADALQSVGLSLPEVQGRYPHELSGGQLQRVAIARALISRPSLLVADEPVSMIDASLRASIVNLLRKLCDQHGLSILYITHDLATAYYACDTIMVMRRGEVVEAGNARAVLDDPQHEYTRLLKSSVLSPEVPAVGVAPHA